MTDLSNESNENLVKIFFDKNAYRYDYPNSDAHSAAKLLIAKGYRFSPDELIIIMTGQFPYTDSTYGHFLADNKYIFTAEELINSGNPVLQEGSTVAHRMVANGYDGFTVDDIIALGDPMNNKRETISILMAKYGHYFPLEEIVRLGNPADTYRISLAHLMAHHCEFSVNDLWKLRNPADRDGDTVSHWVVKAGHRFSVEELKFLNNPKNNNGDSIAHLMAQAGHIFNNDESEELGLPLEIEPKSIFLDIKNGYRFDDGFYGGSFIELYVNGLLCMSVESRSCSGDDITIFNQEAFSVLENYAYSIRHNFDEETFLLYRGSQVRINRQHTILSDSQATAMLVAGKLEDTKSHGRNFPDIGHGWHFVHPA